MRRDSLKDISNLTESTIRIVARDGFDKATTRNIAGDCGLSDSYIYQYFSVKNDLFAYTFAREDAKLASVVSLAIEASHKGSLCIKERCQVIFSYLWKALMSNPDGCRYYIQYYYSPYYPKCSVVDHIDNWSDTIKRMEKYFLPDSDVVAVLRLSLNNILDMALKTQNNVYNNTEALEDFNFEMLYSIVQRYLVPDNVSV